MFKILCSIIILSAVLVCVQGNKTVTTTEKYATEKYETTTQGEETQVTRKDNTGSSVTSSEEKMNNTIPSTDAESSVEVSSSSTTTTTTTTTTTPASDVFNRTEAEAEIKLWADKLDCDSSPLGEFKCTMLKKMVKKFFDLNTDEIQLDKLKTRIKNIIRKIEDGDSGSDPVLKRLLQKYKKFLYT